MLRSLKRGYENGGAVLHTLRHSATIYLSSLGLPLTDIQANPEYDSVAMSLKYIHTTPRGLASAVLALSRFGVRLESVWIPEAPVVPASEAASASENSQRPLNLAAFEAQSGYTS